MAQLVNVAGRVVVTRFDHDLIHGRRGQHTVLVHKLSRADPRDRPVGLRHQVQPACHGGLVDVVVERDLDGCGGGYVVCAAKWRVVDDLGWRSAAREGPGQDERTHQKSPQPHAATPVELKPGLIPGVPRPVTSASRVATHQKGGPAGGS